MLNSITACGEYSFNAYALNSNSKFKFIGKIFCMDNGLFYTLKESMNFLKNQIWNSLY